MHLAAGWIDPELSFAGRLAKSQDSVLVMETASSVKVLRQSMRAVCHDGCDAIQFQGHFPVLFAVQNVHQNRYTVRLQSHSKHASNFHSQGLPLRIA